MKKIATITFQGAHNYGSALQCYALQMFVEGLCHEKGEQCDYRVIDYRTPVQEALYCRMPKINCVKNLIKWVMRVPYRIAYSKKYDAFEQFITQELHTGIPVHTVEEIKMHYGDYDYYISGSDQIWNVRCLDFQNEYYLNFVNDSAKRISYAASFGPLKIDWNQYDSVKYTDYLRKYSGISVREAGSADNVEYLLGVRPQIHVDPTLLLCKDQWKIIQSNRVSSGARYILMYCLEPGKSQLRMVNKISKRLGLPVVVTRYNNKNDYFNHYQKQYDSGPKEFLELVDKAEFVITSSFHGTAFSIIYEKPFFALDGMSDQRICNLLKLTGLEERSVCEADIEYKFTNAEKIDFVKAHEALNNERNKSRRYLMEVLELG